MLSRLRGMTLDRLLFITLLLAVALTFPPFAGRAAWQTSFATYVHAIVLEAFPYLLLGSLIAGIIEWVLPATFLPRLVKRLGPFGLPATIALSPLTPVCECGVLPIARSLMAKGLPLPHTVAYLLAAPIMNPTVILTTYLAFQDWRYPVLRVLGAVFVALAVGALVGRLGAPRVLVAHLAVTPALPLLNVGNAVKITFLQKTSFTGKIGRPNRFAALTGVPLSIGTTPTASLAMPLRQRLGRWSRQVLDHFLDMATYFLVGVFIAAAMKTFFGSRLDLLGDGVVWGPLAMMITAFVLSLCAEADAFVAASFTEFSLPAKLAFLVFGPMFDIKLFLMYRKVFRGRFILLLAASLLVLIELYALAITAVGIQ